MDTKGENIEKRKKEEKAEEKKEDMIGKKEEMTEKGETDLESRIINRIQPAIDAIMQRFMGVRIHELGDDITSRITRNPLLGFDIDTALPLRQGKRRFRKEYLHRLLLQTYGNVSEAARIARMERRSIHRFIIEARINVRKMREEMLRQDYVKEAAIGKTLSEALKEYESILHPAKLKKIYDDIPEISKDILKELPDEPISLKEAEEEFERRYFMTLKKECATIAEVARKARMRYESVHRKMRRLGLIN